MFHLILFQPEIPPNTGNIIRLCANTGATLHLIHPLGFSIDDKHMRRAGLDYHKHVTLCEYENFDECLKKHRGKRIFAVETCGEKNYSDVQFQAGDMLLFGQETKGLPQYVLEKIKKENVLKIPMKKNNRSLNLANAVSIVLYEAWRQHEFL